MSAADLDALELLADAVVQDEGVDADNNTGGMQLCQHCQCGKNMGSKPT